MDASLYLFDDEVARAWEPFALTRPVGEILFGCLLLRERAERFWGLECRGHLAGEALLGFQEGGAPGTLRPDEVGEGDARILLSSRAVPNLGPPREKAPTPEVRGPATLYMDGTCVGWIVPPGESLPSADALARPKEAPTPGERLEIPGSVLERPWDLMGENPDRIVGDVDVLFPGDDAFLPAGVERLGAGAVSTGRDVVIEPGVLLDTRAGPIRLEDGVRVQAPARIEGPCFVGEGTLLLGGVVGNSSIGRTCKVRGEVDSSVILGYSNKAHDGYLGHAVLGRWVNLGAFTTNSDLKNSYGSVRVRTSRGEVDTGRLKVGVFLGDHVKTGIGTLLNTGVVVGAGSNVFGGGMVPGRVPPFSWGTGRELGEYRVEKFLEVAETAMARRDVELTEGAKELLIRAWEATRGQRG